MARHSVVVPEVMTQRATSPAFLPLHFYQAPGVEGLTGGSSA